MAALASLLAAGKKIYKRGQLRLNVSKFGEGKNNKEKRYQKNVQASTMKNLLSKERLQTYLK